LLDKSLIIYQLHDLANGICSNMLHKGRGHSVWWEGVAKRGIKESGIICSIFHQSGKGSKREEAKTERGINSNQARKNVTKKSVRYALRLPLPAHV
jgi:hypothetical protein